MVTGKKGTLKRKTQIQELIQRSEMGYSDDLLDLTPFREKTLRVPVSGTECPSGSCSPNLLTIPVLCAGAAPSSQGAVFTLLANWCFPLKIVKKGALGQSSGCKKRKKEKKTIMETSKR